MDKQTPGNVEHTVARDWAQPALIQQSSSEPQPSPGQANWFELTATNGNFGYERATNTPRETLNPITIVDQELVVSVPRTISNSWTGSYRFHGDSEPLSC